MLTALEIEFMNILSNKELNIFVFAMMYTVVSN